MIIYKRCSEVTMEDIFEAFSQGFADYIIKMSIPKDFFEKRFFGPEGNSPEYSFIAYDDKRPIGVVLGGIKSYEGLKTIRCGALAVVVEYRGMGVSKKLMELHKNEAAAQGCKQMFLEVIVGNERAISFYNKLGYEKIYDMYFYTLKDAAALVNKYEFNIEIKNIGIEALKVVRERIRDIHINWQNDMDYIEKLEGQVTLGAYINNKLVGAVSANKNTRINFIYVENSFRNRGIGTNLILRAASELELMKITAAIPNNSSITGFLKHLGFEKDKLSQYEMYYTL